jgi:hypothetical protein
MWLHHKGCTSPLVEYIGQYPIYAHPKMRRADWKDVDGQHFMGANKPVLRCPDCGNYVAIHSDYLAAMDKTPVAFGLEVQAKQGREARKTEQAAWTRFMHLIT